MTKRVIGILLFLLILLGIFYSVHQLEESEDVEDRLVEKQETNPDVYAWIQVDGTKIDYPIAQHPTDDSYYLSHDLDHQETYYGAIFTERVNTKTFDDFVTIVYGHAMQDESMFGSLDYFGDADFFDSHRQIQVTLANHTLTYEVFAAYSYTDEHLYHTYQLGDIHHVEEYVAQIEALVQANGGFYRETTFDVGRDKLLILSTCDAQTDGRRFVVHAIRKGEK